MQLPWFIHLALRQLKPATRRAPSVFFLLSVLGVALGVAVLVVVQSVMGGFGEVHRERIIDITGHLEITEAGYPFAGAYVLTERLQRRPEVTEAMPYARGFVMARRGQVPVFPAVFGIPFVEDPVFAVDDYLEEGSYGELYDDTVLISRRLANNLGVGLGSEIEIFSPVMIDRVQDGELVLPRVLKVAGIYNIDWNQEFIPGLVTTLRTMQELYDLGDGVHGVALRLEANENEQDVAAALREELSPRKRVLTWREKWADFLWVLDLEKTLMLFLNLFIVGVAVFAIAIAQLLTVVRKTREIGLLSVLGGQQNQVLGLYCFQGFFIGLTGTALGIGMALLALAFRDPIIGGLAQISGTQETLVRYYYFANLPVNIDLSEIILIGTLATLLATLASLVPAWRAARLKPAETLRVEQ